PLSAIGPAADCLHHLRPAPRPDAGGDRHGAGETPAAPGAERARLGPSFGYLGVADRRAHSRAAAPEDRPDRVYRMRLPVARPLRDRQPGRLGSPLRLRATLLDRRPSSVGRNRRSRIPPLTANG